MDKNKAFILPHSRYEHRHKALRAAVCLSVRNLLPNPIPIPIPRLRELHDDIM